MSITVNEALARAVQCVGIVDARALLTHTLERDAAYLIAHGDDALDAGRRRTFDELLERRVAGEPIPYLTGRREFYGLDLHVTPAVLIPRPETELLVDLALERLPVAGDCSVLDLGTGSGCVAVAIAKHRPRARVVAVDVSEAALALARDNAQSHSLVNIEFHASDWFSVLGDRRFDLIAANPPYVAAGDSHLARGDLRFEPSAALIAAEDGYACLRTIAVAAPSHLVARGWLLFEHGHEQGAACRALLARAGYSEVFSRRDLAGIDRVAGGRRP